MHHQAESFANNKVRNIYKLRFNIDIVNYKKG